ncbi:MAG: DUF4097 family beta strand repeat-containing protein [Clostridiales bacterium]|jgi:DUF4097 and DUF4098 domain-containing protein YvlB|nr:DUF4097 family beta strand repeat-containing protein [Clostridiales bacterium]
MSEEKLKILELLKEGKINTEEALSLLNQVSDEKTETCGYGGNNSDYENYNTGANQNNNENDNGYGYKTPERTFWGAAPGKTNANPYPYLDLSFLDDIRGAVQDAFTGGMFWGWREETFREEIEAAGQVAYSFVLNGKNAPVKLECRSGNKIEIEVNYKLKFNRDAHISLRKENGEIYLDYDPNALYSLGVKAYVPKGFTAANVSLNTSNAQIAAKDITCQILELNTKNAHIKAEDVNAARIDCKTTNAYISFDNVNADEIKAQTSNAKISLEESTAYRANLTTSNAGIMLDDTGVAQLDAKTSNAGISIDDLKLTRSENDCCYIDATTSNAGIALRVPRGDYPVKLRASTSHAGISNDISGLTYLVNEKNYIEAQSAETAQSGAKLNINLKTSNGGIHIKK